MTTPQEECLRSLFAEWPAADHFSRRVIIDGQEVGSIDLVPTSEGIHISLISMIIQGAGHGQATLEIIKERAETFGCEVSLWCFRNPGEEDGGRLMRWYARNGFEEISEPDEDDHVIMVRPSLVEKEIIPEI